MLEYQLARQCAPTFAGMKPANLLSVSRAEPEILQQNLRETVRRLRAGHIRFFLLRRWDNRVLFLVYNSDMLEQQLNKPEHAEFLRRYGYRPEKMTIPEMLVLLSKRMQSSEDYPHEIGVFLGYPLCDVSGFIEHKGQNFQLCGYWKVYSDVQRTKQLFSVYDQVREFFCEQVLGGKRIESIVYGGA